jgi:hypothetical protein
VRVTSEKSSTWLMKRRRSQETFDQVKALKENNQQTVKRRQDEFEDLFEKERTKDRRGVYKLEIEGGWQ